MNWLPDAPVLQGLAIVGATCGALGCFAVLRRQSLFGDTLAHAALPGVCLAYLVFGAKDLTVLMAGATVSGVIGTLLVLGLLRGSRLKQDAALGIILSTFFALGLMLLTYFQNRGDGNQSGLDTFIYGKAAFLRHEQVVPMFLFGAVVLTLLIVFYKEFKLLSFDPEYTSTLGFRRRLLELLLALLLVLTVMISLRAVGVVLTVGLLVAPAAAARQWTHRLSWMMIIAVAIGIGSGIGGAIWSLNMAYTPTGPAVVLVASSVMILSLLFAPQRGLLGSWLRLWQHRRTVRRENLLSDLYRLGERQRAWQGSWTTAQIAAVRDQPPRPLEATLRTLEESGQVVADTGRWRLTRQGLEEASRVVRNHRLWELYLAKRLDLPVDHVHRDAEAMEHALPPELVAELEATLENPDIDPQGKPIPRSSSSLFVEEIHASPSPLAGELAGEGQGGGA
jgi:manganese/zinc/iron transport system permease protein